MAAPMPGSPPPRLTSRYFLAELARLLPNWEADGLVSHEDVEKLDHAYNLAEFVRPSPERPRVDPTTMAIRLAFLIGGLLLGFGIIAFVAANWAAIPDYGRALIVNAGVVGLYLSGYYFWFKKNLQPLGHSLLFAGALAFGADLALMAQNFNFSLPHFGGYAAWALGVLALALAVRSLPLVVLGLIAGFIALFGGALDLEAIPNLVRFFGAAVILAAVARFSPFRWLYGVSFGLVIIESAVFVGQATEDAGPVFATLFLTFGLLAAASAAARSISPTPLDRAGEAAAWIMTPLLALVSSLTFLSSAIAATSPSPSATEPRWNQAVWLDGFLLAAMAVLGAFALLKTKRESSALALPLATLTAAASIALCQLLPYLAVSTASTFLAILLSWIAFGTFTMANGLHSSHRIRFAHGYFSLLLSAIPALWLIGEGLDSYGAPILALMIIAALWSSGRVLCARQETEALAATMEPIAWAVVGGASAVTAFHSYWDHTIEVGVAKSLADPAATLILIGGLAALLFGGSALIRRLSVSRNAGPGSFILASGAAMAFAGGGRIIGLDTAVSTGLCVLASIGFGAGLVAKGLEAEERSLYWIGSIYLIASILIRFFEYETSNLAKSVAFLISGALVILAGAYFDRRSRHGREMHHVG